jgi:hydrogenase 3 maturation protease
VPENLKKILGRADKKILFVGIGNVLRMDDGAGVFISSGIKNKSNISALTVEVSLENYIGKINSLNPDILILIDTIDIGMAPGSYKLLQVDQIKDMTFNTHNISLKRLSEFFKMQVYLLGIQPEKIDFGENMSYIVRKEAEKIVNIINSH